MKFNVKKIIDQMGKEYAQLIVDNIKESYNFSDINEDNLDYCKKKDMEVKDFLRRYVLNDKRQKMLKTIQSFGKTYLLLGTVIFALMYLREKMGTIYYPAFVFIVIGITILIFSCILEIIYVFLEMSKQKKLVVKKFKNTLDNYEETRKKLLVCTNNSLNRANLVKLGIFSDKDISLIQKLEQMRNIYSGENKKYVSFNDLKRITDIINKN